MKNRFTRAAAALLSLLLCLGTLSALTLQSFAEQEEDLQKGDFAYAPHTYTEGDLSDIYYYTDAFFDGPATEYDPHLATMSMILAAASIGSQEKGVAYVDKSQNLDLLLRDLDFSNFDVNESYMERPEEQSMGVGMAYKVIGEGDEAYTLLAIVPRSAGYEREWAGNFTVGKDGLHQGFVTGRDIVLEFAKSYVEENADNFEGEIKVWTVGYSRGAGVANLLAAYLNDNAEALGVAVKKENIFAYTFGTPSNVQYATEEEKALLESNYLNIHNRYSEYDIVTFVPFREWGFTCYGKTQLLNVHDAEKKAEMKAFLEKTNPTVHDLYFAENSSADPDNFAPVMLQIGENGEVSFVAADPAYGIPTDQAAFLENRIAFLVNHLVPDRETYVDGGYEYALQRLTSLYFGLDAEGSAALIEGMSHDLPTLAAAYYAYFLTDFYLTGDADAHFAAICGVAEALNALEDYVLALAENEAFNTQEWYLYVSAFLGGEEYATLVQLLNVVIAQGAGSAIAEEAIATVKTTVSTFAYGVTARVLGGGVNALPIEDEEEKAELLATMTAPEVAAPLTDFLAYLLLGTENEVPNALYDPSNEHIALAVTFLYNSGRYMRAHNNEIILSWLRTEDSYYANEDWHVHSMDLLHSADGHWQECACGHKEELCAHSFGEWEKQSAAEGEQEMLVRRCPCGYTETKPAETNPSAADALKSIPPAVIVSLCAGAVILVAGAAVVIVVLRKRKLAE